MKSLSYFLKRLRSVLIALALLAGCAEPTVLDPPFGESVRHMIAVQTTDPSLDAPGLDGYKAVRGLEIYRGIEDDSSDDSSVILIQGN